MSEEEALGKLAYEGYEQEAIKQLFGVPRMGWEKLPPFNKSLWIAAAKAVAERVLQEVQVAEEASE